MFILIINIIIFLYIYIIIIIMILRQSMAMETAFLRRQRESGPSKRKANGSP